MDDVFFESFLRKKFAKVTETQRKKAAFSAKTYTAEQLQNYCEAAATGLAAETRLVGASVIKERLAAAARQELEKYEIALDAKRAWNRVGPYEKQYSFRPSETG
ncbi:MAG: uncharacterized protein A8A55_3550, partial [Amphiamblys sp. WSBS2006]